MRIVARGTPLRYEEVGQGRPIILFTGWALDSRFMIRHYEPIFEQRSGWRRIYPDMPGMGMSPRADWIHSQDDMLETAMGFLDAVAPGERPSLVGASWGAYIALGIAHERGPQLDGMMLVVPVIQPERALRDVPEHVVLRADPQVVADLAADEAQWAEIAVVQSRESLMSYRETIKPALALADLPFLDHVSERYALSFTADRLAEPFPAPVLLLAGRQDSACGYRDAWPLLSQMPRATFAVLDRAGHDLADVQPKLFRALTSEWLDRVEEYAASREAVAAGAR